MDLTNLLIDDKELDEQLLGETLSSYVRIAKDSGKIRFTSEINKLPNRGLILMYLLGKKAASVLKIDSIHEETSPIELETELGMSGGSLRPTLLRLLNEGMIERSEGKYRVPNYKISEIGTQFNPTQGDMSGEDIPF
jgi:hypothetical protein